MNTMKRKVMCVLVAMTVIIGVISPKAEAATKIKYKTYSNTRFVYTVKYPTAFTKKTDSGTQDGTKLTSSDGKAQATIWNSYGSSKKRNGKSVVATAKKSHKISVVKVSAKECSYTYASGKNVVQYYYCFLSNGEIAFQLTYPKSEKAYYTAAAEGMMSSIKANKSLTLKD